MALQDRENWWLPAQSYQIKNIRILQKKLRVDEETYRLALEQFRCTATGVGCTSAKELTTGQADKIIDQWRESCVRAGIRVHLYQRPKTKPATPAQLDRLRYFAIRCAICYCTDATFAIDGQARTGKELSRYCMRQWANKAALPAAILRHYFNAWINPMSNKWLVQGGFLRSPPRNPNACYHNRLTPDAANYLIQRFERMAQNLDNSQLPQIQEHY